MPLDPPLVDFGLPLGLSLGGDGDSDRQPMRLRQGDWTQNVGQEIAGDRGDADIGRAIRLAFADVVAVKDGEPGAKHSLRATGHDR